MAKNDKMTLDEENAEKAMYAGMLKKDIIAGTNAIEKQKTKSAELSGDLSAAMGLFDKLGGRKDALKDVNAFLRMEPSEFADYWRALLGYGLALGLFGEDGKPAQLDMLDQEEEQQKNGDSISAATAAANAGKPKMAEAVTH